MMGNNPIDAVRRLTASYVDWVCLGLIDTSVSYPPVSTNWHSAEYAADGALYLGAVDYLYRWDVTTAVALLSGTTAGTDIIQDLNPYISLPH